MYLLFSAVVSCQDSCNASGDHQTAFEEYGKMRHLEEALEVLKLHNGDDGDDDCGGGATDGDDNDSSWWLFLSAGPTGNSR